MYSIQKRKALIIINVEIRYFLRRYNNNMKEFHQLLASCSATIVFRRVRDVKNFKEKNAINA